MAVQVAIPEVGESVTEVILVEWLKKDGEAVEKDEPICVLETDKADIELPAPASGVLKQISKIDDTIEVGGVVAEISEDGEAVAVSQPEPAKKEPAKKEEPKAAAKKEPAKEEKKSAAAEELSPAVRRMVTEEKIDPSKIEGTGKGGRITKEDVVDHVEGKAKESKKPAEEPISVKKEIPATEAAPKVSKAKSDDGAQYDEEGVKRVAMTKIRKKIADRLVRAQQTAALLTTFNEIDMTAVANLRKKYKERFEEVHGVSLGMMSVFTRAAVLALQEFAGLNAFIEGEDVLYHKNIHMGIAVSTERGLVVPVLREAETMSLAQIEFEIRRLAKAAREGKLGINELSGGTFSITNGGVFGSMLSTPIVNTPQSGILGMHAIQKRPVVVDDQIQIREMMYVALTYDHRIVDGKEAVSFLVRVKQMVEDPVRLILGI